MGTYFRNLFIYSLAILIISCSSELVPNPNDTGSLSEPESMLVGTWQYETISVSDEKYDYADEFNEPGFLRSTLGSRADITRRRIRFSREKTYQVIWLDRGNYQLGTEGDPNWQPNFGYWDYNEETDSLYHNPGLYYQVAYKITNNGLHLTRITQRHMSSNQSSAFNRFWNKGDTVVFTEQFVKISY